MNPVLIRRLAIVAGVLVARLAARALPGLTPGDARWIDGALEVLLFAAESWLRSRSLSLRRSTASEEENPARAFHARDSFRDRSERPRATPTLASPGGCGKVP